MKHPLKDGFTGSNKIEQMRNTKIEAYALNTD